jgi:hypothetical protein
MPLLLYMMDVYLDPQSLIVTVAFGRPESVP